MEKIIIDLNKIKDIRNVLESVIRTSQKVDSVNFKKIIKQYQTDLPEYLNEFERKVFEYIRKNPGVSKEDVVKAMVGTRSRGPVYTIIENLEKYGLVFERPDDTNAQRLQLFENKESLIIQIENNIKNFKKSYLNLLKKASQDYQKKRNLRSIDIELGSSRSKVASEFYAVYIDIDLRKILEQLIKGYAIKAIFEWPEKIKDSESLNRLYLMVFHMLADIFSEHVKYSIPWGIEDEHERLVLLRESLQDSFEATIYQDLIPGLNKYNWDPELVSVMSDLFTALNTDLKWKDMRKRLVKH
jgi:hypothetical protein